MTTRSDRRYIELDELAKSLEADQIQLIRIQEQTSLTSNHDTRRLQSKRQKNPNPVPVHNTRPPIMGVSLTDAEVVAALEENIREFPRVEKVWLDPPYRNQNFTLVSFVPSRGAKPDEDGVFGLFKVRGTFTTEDEAITRSRELIRDADSYHIMFVGEVGRALPITIDNEKFAAETTKVELTDKASAIVDQYVVDKKREEERAQQDVIRRQKELMAAVSADPDSNVSKAEHYTMLQTKRAEQIYGIVNMLQRLRPFRQALLNTIDAITQMDEKNPEFKTDYMTRYRRACSEVGIRPDSNPLIQYMVADQLPFDIENELAFHSSVPEADHNPSTELKNYRQSEAAPDSPRNSMPAKPTSEVFVAPAAVPHEDVEADAPTPAELPRRARARAPTTEVAARSTLMDQEVVEPPVHDIVDFQNLEDYMAKVGLAMDDEREVATVDMGVVVNEMEERKRMLEEEEAELARMRTNQNGSTNHRTRAGHRGESDEDELVPVIVAAALGTATAQGGDLTLNRLE